MSDTTRKKRIVCICGGTGGHALLEGLAEHNDVYPIAITNVTDSGKSSGRIREMSHGSLPPGDARQCVHALLNKHHPDYETMHRILTFRFPDHLGDGHSAGNLFIMALEKLLGGFDKALKVFEPYMVGRVIPVTLDDVHLLAIYEDGDVAFGEHNIDVPPPGRNSHMRISQLKLLPKPGHLTDEAREAILAANLIVIGPGDLFTSVLPNLMMEGMRQTLLQSRAPKAYVANVMTKRGETLGFGVHDFMKQIDISSTLLTHVLHNTTSPSATHLQYYYQTEGTEPVQFVERKAPRGPAYIGADVLAVYERENEGPLIRHDPAKLARALLSIIA